MKKIIFIILTLLSFIIIYKSSINIFTNNSKKDNFQFGNINILNYLPTGVVNKPLLKGDMVSINFKANYNNLGIIELLINNYSRVNSDHIIFKLREKDSISSIFVGNYDTSIMDEGQFFPFGFPVQSNSKGKSYIIEIISSNGSKNNFVSISENSDSFKTKYVFTKSDIYTKPKDTLIFAFKKAEEIIKYFNIYDYVHIYFLAQLPFLILFSSLIIYINIISKNRIGIKINYGLMLILALYFIAHLNFLNYSQFWDSEWYLQLLLSAVSKVVNYRGSIYGLLHEIVVNYNFLGHPSMGYVSILSIGQLFDLGNVVYLNITNIILGIFAIIAYYYFINYLYPKKFINNLILVGIFAFNPLFFATSISLNLDYAVLIFLTLSISSLFNRKYYLFVLFSTLLVFSKETGLLIYTSVVFATLVYKFDEIKNKKYIFIMPILIFLVYLYSNNWSFWNANALNNSGNRLLLNLQNNGMFSLGFNLDNIKVRLFHIFIMNFNWVITPFILVGIFKIKNNNYKFLLCILVPFLAFNLFYTVMPFARYAVSSIFMIISLFYISINELIRNKSNIRPILILILFLMVIQIYKPLDPSSIILYGKNYIGKNVSSPVFGFRDGLVYNSNFYFVEALSSMIRERNDKSEGVVLNVGAQYFFKQIGDVGTVEDINKINKKYKKLEYIYAPWFADLDPSISILSKYYDISFKNRINYNGYYVDVYNLDPI